MSASTHSIQAPDQQTGNQQTSAKCKAVKVTSVWVNMKAWPDREKHTPPSFILLTHFIFASSSSNQPTVATVSVILTLFTHIDYQETLHRNNNNNSLVNNSHHHAGRQHRPLHHQADNGTYNQLSIEMT